MGRTLLVSYMYCMVANMNAVVKVIVRTYAKTHAFSNQMANFARHTTILENIW